jgi:AraC-like DNA-binding protein
MTDPIVRVHQYIGENLEAPMSVAALAEVACMSAVHFSRKFKEANGIPPALYVEVHKIRQSLIWLKEDSLLQKGMQVQEMAFRLGFANYETFSRAFKRHVQIAPADLKHVLTRLYEETGFETPLLLASVRSVEKLQQLVQDALKDQPLLADQLPQLQLCILSRKQGRYNHRAGEKYLIYKDQELAMRLLDALH